MQNKRLVSGSYRDAETALPAHYVAADAAAFRNV